jgi:hypothetical protein
MSCCKRISGGICEHDRQDAQARVGLQEAQIRYDMKRPGISTWEVEKLQEQLDNLPDPRKGHVCPACKRLLREKESHERTHDGAYGEQTYYVCGI